MNFKTISFIHTSLVAPQTSNQRAIANTTTPLPLPLAYPRLTPPRRRISPRALLDSKFNLHQSTASVFPPSPDVTSVVFLKILPLLSLIVCGVMSFCYFFWRGLWLVKVYDFYGVCVWKDGKRLLLCFLLDYEVLLVESKLFLQIY